MSIETFYYNFKNKIGLADVFKKLDPTKLWRVRIDEYDIRTLEQNSKLHAMLSDVARQAKHLNQVLEVDDWKRLAVHQFRVDCIVNDMPRLADYWKRNSFRLIPSLDGRSLVSLGTQTRDMPKYVVAGLIEWLYHYGAENNIEWSEPEEQFDERYAA